MKKINICFGVLFCICWYGLQAASSRDERDDGFNRKTSSEESSLVGNGERYVQLFFYIEKKAQNSQRYIGYQYDWVVSANNTMKPLFEFILTNKWGSADEVVSVRFRCKLKTAGYTQSIFNHYVNPKKKKLLDREQMLKWIRNPRKNLEHLYFLDRSFKEYFDYLQSSKLKNQLINKEHALWYKEEIYQDVMKALTYIEKTDPAYDTETLNRYIRALNMVKSDGINKAGIEINKGMVSFVSLKKIGVTIPSMEVKKTEEKIVYKEKEVIKRVPVIREVPVIGTFEEPNYTRPPASEAPAPIAEVAGTAAASSVLTYLITLKTSSSKESKGKKEIKPFT